MKLSSKIKHIHFIGICGYIMSAMAVILDKMGYKITGSDQDAYPPGTDTVNRAGIVWFKQYSPSNLGRPDLVVIGNHIRSDNPEAKATIKKKLKLISLPELIGKIFADKRRIVIAGTHGKTTTTSLIAWILEKAGLGPSYLVGGIIQNTGQGFQLGKGDFFVVEGDEYQTAFFDKKPKFFHYKPEMAVLTTCELDHPDYFKNLSGVKKTFLKFLNLVPKNGLVFLGVDDPQVAKIFQEINRPRISFGLSQKAKYKAFGIELKALVRFKAKRDNKFLGKFQSKLPGKINLQNALAAIAVADQLGISLEKIRQGVATFKGVERRFEIVGKPKGITIIDDYAHHPTKIRKTLAAARTRYKKNKIYSVFEPHTYTRTKALLSHYARAFGQADEVIVAKLMAAREAGQRPSISSSEVVEAIKKYHSNVKFIPQSEEILEYLASKASQSDVVIIMSVGGLNNLARRLVDAI